MPSRCTVHAPQRATPQPNLVPFMPRKSRKTHSNGMSGDASTVWDLPLISNVTMINLPTHPEKTCSWQRCYTEVCRSQWHHKGGSVTAPRTRLSLRVACGLQQ